MIQNVKFNIAIFLHSVIFYSVENLYYFKNLLTPKFAVDVDIFNTEIKSCGKPC